FGTSSTRAPSFSSCANCETSGDRIRALPPNCLSASYQRKKLIARREVVAEHAEHRRSEHGGVLLLNAAHHHAQVARLDHHAHALGVDRLHDDLRDLVGETLLELEAPRVDVHQSRELAHAEHLAV